MLSKKEGTMNTTKTFSVKITTKHLALTGLMAAIICILGPWSLVLPFSPVPISMGTLAIYFVVSVMGMKKGTVSVIIYMLLGLAGLPVFTGFTGGPGKLLGPTGGYLFGYLFMAVICGFFADKFWDKIWLNFLGMLVGTAACYFFGTLWLAYQASLSFHAALAAGVLPFIIGDLAKIIFALMLGIPLRKRLRRAGLL